MKIPNNIRIIYNELKVTHERLKTRVDEILEPSAKERRWHYESRIKSELSVALKLETGRIPNPQSIEDFFACMLVVRNITEIDSAESLIGNTFSIKYRRPRENKRTHKAAFSFPFDDLRIYARLKKDDRLPSSKLEDITFEIQVKTFLQHAWSIATHDLIYKTDEVNWSKERIAYQIKAMLEHAELSIQEADMLSKTTFIEKEDVETLRVKEVIKLLQDVWPEELLPLDMRRLAQNINNVIEAIKITRNRLSNILNEEKSKFNGIIPINITPYAFVIQTLLHYEEEKMKKFISGGKQRQSIVVYSDIEIPGWLQGTGLRNIVRI